MESHPFALDMQKEMIQEVETANPKYLVFVNITFSWLMTSKSNTLIFEWVESYIMKHYEPIGIIDILGYTQTYYLWGEKVKRYKPRSD